MVAADIPFDKAFKALTGFQPMAWQDRLFARLMAGDIPSALDLPTGLGKTSVIALWLIARAYGAKLPRRCVYVVDRRAVVDQATAEAVKLRCALEGEAEHFGALDESARAQAKQTIADLKERLGFAEDRQLPISTLRGAYVDNREWLVDPATSAIIVGTVDMIGSRLLFSGYGVSRKMRPYQAGLLGADVLIVLDEAHLVPPFAHLLATIEDGKGLLAQDSGVVPCFQLLPLSATQRKRLANDSKEVRKPFRLETSDLQHDDIAAERFHASKRLYLEPAVEKNWDAALAAKAWELATKDGRYSRVAVFCNRRDNDKQDELAGPSVMQVLEELQTLAKGDKKTGIPALELACELLVGGRRVKERQDAAENLRQLGFAGGGERPDHPEKPTFLLATSAGEVGVDFDADHMVSDLAPWERMVQRLGRVNRRGGKGREASVAVFDTSEMEKNEDRKARLKETLGLLERIGQGGQLNSASLIELRNQVGAKKIEDASTAEPLRPALTRALVDAWSMTSLERHTGRPDISPWLRGWIEDERPQTTVIWRKYLPVRFDEQGHPFVPEKDANDFFEAAPSQESEKLESETFRFVDWMEERSRRLMPEGKGVADTRKGYERDHSETEAAEIKVGDDAADEAVALNDRPLSPKDIVAITLSPAGDFERYFTLGALARERKGRDKEEFFRRLIERTLVLDSRFCGLTGSGMLDSRSDGAVKTADACDDWSKEVGFRVKHCKSSDQDQPVWPSGDVDWLSEEKFAVRSNADGDTIEILVVEDFKGDAKSEDGRSVRPNPQVLAEHECCAENKALLIGAKVGLSGGALEALALAARLHDEGKRAERWQRAFRAKRDSEKFGLTGPLAKTRGPIDQNVLDGYRHEFGSLAVFEPNHVWRKNLPDNVRERIEILEPERDWFDLLQHLVASHHGGARPVISTRNCEDAPPSALEGRARDVALRFARLQKHWGPWALAWWEALLRAADQQASRENDRRDGNTEPKGSAIAHAEQD